MAIAYLYRSNYSPSPKEFMDYMAKAQPLLKGGSEWEKMYYDFENSFVSNDWNKRVEILQKLIAAYPDAARPQIDFGFAYQAANETEKERAAFCYVI